MGCRESSTVSESCIQSEVWCDVENSQLVGDCGGSIQEFKPEFNPGFQRGVEYTQLVGEVEGRRESLSQTLAFWNRWSSMGVEDTQPQQQWCWDEEQRWNQE